MGIITPKKIDFGPTDVSLGKGPPSGLVPVGETGIYMTPDEPADVFDCNRYPDSIYCGGNPLSITPIGIDANLEIDNCGATVTATPIVAFVKLPPLNVSYRLPGECRNEYEKTRDVKQPKFDAPAFETFGCADLSLFDVDDEKTVYAFVSGQFAAVNNPNKICDGGFVSSQYQENNSCSEFLCPGTPVNIAGITRATEVSCSARCESTNSNIAGPFDRNRNCHVGMGPNQTGDFTSRAYFTLDDRIDYYVSADGRLASYDRPRQSQFNVVVDSSAPKPWYKIQRSDTETTSYAIIYKGKWGLLKAFLGRPPTFFLEVGSMAGKVVDHRKFYQNVCFSVIEVGCKVVPRTLNYQLPPPPPPPPPKKECCVSCCSPSQQQDQKDYTALLQQILKECQKANKSIGVFPQEIYLYDSDEDTRGAQGKTEKVPDIASSIRKIVDRIEVGLKIAGIEEFPVSLPASLISKDEGWLGNLIPNFNIQVKNQTTLMGWFIERFDEVVGQFEIPIEIKDSDPTQQGDQPKGIKIPNVAEAIAEMFGMLFQISVNSETLVNMSARTLTETGLTRQQAFKNYTYSQAIAEHLAFEFREKSHKVPFLFTPGKDSLDDFLQEKELDVIGIEYADKISLKGNVADLLQSAAIIRAVFWRKLNPKGDVAQEMFNLIKNQKNNSDAIQNPKDAEDKSDFDRFLEDVEVGFINETGMSDTTNPYGRDYEQRPRLRKIGDNQTDGSGAS